MQPFRKQVLNGWNDGSLANPRTLIISSSGSTLVAYYGKQGSTAPPSVAITSPPNNSNQPSGMVLFTGTASSGVSINGVMLFIDGNASSYQLATPNAPGDWSTWSINYNLPMGSHWFTARVTDSLNRQAWNSVTVVGQ